MKNLGKIFLILFLYQLTLNAEVSATVNANNIEAGEMVTLSINIDGEDIQKPEIYKLCDSDILSTGSQTSINIVNGNYQKSYTLTYQFSPEKSCEIKPIEIVVGGEIQKTNLVKINVQKQVATKDSAFSLVLSSSSKELMVGEPFDVTLTFKQRRDAEAVDSKFIPPELKGFWIKGETKPKRVQTPEYIITTITYTMAPQREGILKITPAKMKIATRKHIRDSWGGWSPRIQWKNYYSNELSIDVKPLPAGLKLIGDFTIKAIADKNTISKNEAVNVKIEVVGEGNLEDIQSFKPNIEGVSSFAEKIDVNKTKLSQSLAFVSDKDFVIPPFVLRYFDPQTKEIKTISTKEINIKVRGSEKVPELIVKKAESSEVTSTQSENSSFSYLSVLIGFLIGLACGIFVMMLKPFAKKEKAFNIKDEKALIIKLLPFEYDARVAKIIDELEQKVYRGVDIKIDKKLLKELLKEFGI